MRHGYLSNNQGTNLSPQALAKADETTQLECPRGHYGKLFTAKEPRTPVKALVDPAVIGRPPTPPAGHAAIPPQSDELQAALAKISNARSSGVDTPPDDKLGNIPAGYTYFGQLVVHDITHSTVVTDRGGPVLSAGNLNTPSLDLDTIYGGGPARCPHLYQPAYLGVRPGSDDDGQSLFYLGRTARAAFPENGTLADGLPLDLPRIDTDSHGIAPTTPSSSVTPLINDNRNDDNLILAQLTTQFLLVHNKVASFLYENGDPTRGNQELDRKESFELARHFLLKAYRRVVMYDYLERLLFPSTYKELMEGKVTKTDELPIEFVFGVARIGHAMVRAAYSINDKIGMETGGLGRLMAFSSSSPGARLPLPADWVVDWSRLLKMKEGDKPQSARRISPFLAPAFVHGDLRSRRTGIAGSLAFHDLWRCYQFGLPTGQECAEQALKQSPTYILSADDMKLTAPFVDLHPSGNLVAALEEDENFRKKTPLSYYLAQESAKFCNGRFLGPLGSHIYARTIMLTLQPDPSYTPPPGQTGLAFDDIVKPKPVAFDDGVKPKPEGIWSLPVLLQVANMEGDELAKITVDTLK